MTLVMKFGGTSVGSGEAMRRTAGLVRQAREMWPDVVVVASAMSGVTDMLVSSARDAAAGEATAYRDAARAVRRKHYQAISELLHGQTGQRAAAEIDRLLERYEALCKAVRVLGELTPRALDTISAMGEQMSIRILAAQLQLDGIAAEAIDASALIITDDSFQAAVPLAAETAAATEARLRPLLAAGTVPVVTGFMGATREGATTTLGRGGSDYSAAILGRALAADELWIWTDVDGVMTADPRLVPEARSIPTLSYREVAELAYYGAKVLHPKTIRPVVENNIPLRIKNTFNPDHPGTLIVSEAAGDDGKIKAVTAIRALSLVNVEGKGMMGVPGIAARTFGAVAHGRVSVLLITQASSEQSICFAVPDEAAEQVVAALEGEFAAELARRDIDRISAMRPVSIVTVVGAGMRGTPGIAGRLFSALGGAQVNIIAIAQGSSECSISMVVANDDAAAAERAIHSLIGAA